VGLAKYCCAEFAKAREWGSDNEGYGELVEDHLPSEPPGLYTIGTGLRPIKFCPWCGTVIVIEISADAPR
jgi:hypothetical protein